MAGINTENANFKHITIKSYSGDRSKLYVAGQYGLLNDKITLSWAIKASTLTFRVEIPLNTNARI
jgi:alpha-L-rhamnosidase